MMTIPDDIKAAVEALMTDVQGTVGTYDGWEFVTSVRLVACALLSEREAATKAEREKCAAVAQKLYDDWNTAPYVPGPSVDEPPTAMHAATAIRSGTRP